MIFREIWRDINIYTTYKGEFPDPLVIQQTSG